MERNKHYYVGIDGGGTKTEIEIQDASFQVVANAVAGPSNPNDIGKNAVFAVLNELITKNIPADCASFDVSIGLSGLKASGIQDELMNKLKAMPGCRNVYLESDIRIALDSCYPDCDGAIAICGTGNVIYLRKNNEYKLIGGLGYLYDHSLSGFDIGSKVIERVLNESQGSAQASYLAAIVSNENSSTSEILRRSYTDGKKYIASFCHYAFNALGKDGVAESILKECMSGFEKKLQYLLSFCNEITIIGGLSAQWNVLKEYLSKDIRKKLTIKVSKERPIKGAFVRFK